MSPIGILNFRPHSGHERELQELLMQYVSVLKQAGFVPEQKEVLLQSDEGNYLLLLAWKSVDAFELSKTEARVSSIWKKLQAICEVQSLAKLPESKERFPTFRRLS